jgi:hypothetical protein
LILEATCGFEDSVDVAVFKCGRKRDKPNKVKIYNSDLITQSADEDLRSAGGR